MASDPTYSFSPRAQVLFRDLGLDASRVMRRAGQPEDLFHRGPHRISADAYHALWAAMEAEVGDGCLPVAMAEAVSLESFDPVMLAIVCCPDLRAAAHRIGDYKPLVGPVRMTVREDDGGLIVTKRWPETATPPPTLALAEMLFWVAIARLATRVHVQPLTLCGPHVPGDLRPYRDYLGVDIQRGDTWTLTFTELDARRPFLTANEPLWDFFEPELRRRLAALEQHASTADRVRAVLNELLPAGDVTLVLVARKLAMSTRTLQRRLGVEEVTFQSLLGEVRASLARHYLTHSELPAAEISFLLGYDDPNSFYRAFHAWTGSTPEAVRHGREG